MTTLFSANTDFLARLGFRAIMPAALALASCGSNAGVDSSAKPTTSAALAREDVARFDEPWAVRFVPGTDWLAITRKPGALVLFDTKARKSVEVSGVPKVDYGGQGGLGDLAFLRSEAAPQIGERTIYLSYAEAGANGTRGAAVGSGTLGCNRAMQCAIKNFSVIWRQQPKTSGRGHYSHRLRLSPDERYLFVASGDRQKMTPAQDLTNNLGAILRLTTDGTPATGNPFAKMGPPTNQIWSYGHRNILGMDFDAQGRLWEVEHGPAGGDELNLVRKGANYGWPERSFGDHYSGETIPDHAPGDGFAHPALHWTPVIAPSDMLFYRGELFGDWRGDALITGLSSRALVRVRIEGENAREITRYRFDERLRSLDQARDGALWIAEDGENARLWRVAPSTH